MTDDGYFIKSLFRRQSSLNVLALMASAIGPLICTILVGRYFGSRGLAVMALCSPLYLAASFFGYIISGGAQIVCSVFIAKDETENVNKAYSAAVILTIIADIFICGFLLLLRTPVLTLIAGNISPELSAYYKFFVLNSFATMFACIPMFFSRAVGRMGISLILTGIMTSVGIAASFVLIQFMGIEAIALGQAVGTTAGFIVSMFLLRKYYRFIFPKKLFIKEIFTSGSPIGLTRCYVLLTTITLNTLFMRVGGSEAVAVYGVVAILHRFSLACKSGISQTLVPLVSVFNQEQDITSIKQTMRLVFLYGNGIVLIIGVLFNVFSAQIAALFKLPAESGLSAIMPFYTVYALILMNTMILTAYYNAIKKLGLANVIPFLQEFALICMGAYSLAAAVGSDGIWLAFPLSGVVTLFILLILLTVIKFRRKQKGLTDLTFLLLQNSRLEKDGRYISFSVENDLIKASEAAAKISEFCEENRMLSKQTMLISMSVEEIITLIINNSRHKNFSVSVRLFLLDGSIVLRIRNAGEKFDAIEYYKANIADDIEKSLEVIGMKYIVQSASAIYYRQTFGVNSLVVII